MLEWLVTIGAAELGKAIFEQVLKLRQAAAIDTAPLAAIWNLSPLKGKPFPHAACGV